jgi:hypothetical protein
MKKLILLFTVILAMIIASPVFGQNFYLEYKIKVLGSVSRISPEVEAIIFYTTKDVIRKDSVDIKGRRIIHFPEQEVAIDEIIDTVIIDSNYLKYEDKILEAFHNEGEMFFSANNSHVSSDSWSSLGFWAQDTIKTDTAKFVYQKLDKRIITARAKKTIIKDHLNFPLIFCWVIFLTIPILFFFFEKVLEKREWHFTACLVTFALVLISIISSKSILLLAALVILGIIGVIIYGKIKRTIDKPE